MVYFLAKLRNLSDITGEMLQFPAGRNDDIVDAIGWGARLSLAMEPPKEVEDAQSRTRDKSWKSKLWQFTGNGKRSFMGA